MKVRETQLPGIGVRYNVEFEPRGELVVVLHNDGDRETFWKDEDDRDGDKLFEASEVEARKLAEIFTGTYFQPVGPELDELFEESRVRWIHIPADSPVAGQSIQDSKLRAETGVSVIAIQREEQTIQSPAGEEHIRGGDVIVAVGDDDQHAALERMIA